MKHIALGLLLWSLVPIPSSAQSSEEMYQVVAFKASIIEAIKESGIWKTCGDYFAAAESTEGKIIHFNFKKSSADKLSQVFAFSKIDRIVISIDEKVTAPIVAVMGNRRDAQFILKMNVEDYKAGLPCLANGTNT